ncbi:hypothetical protein AB0I28_37435, partial [Phytomonospora sp. NPDC050363]|uniref:hypothetical protein n=1 Tax=Phytomonospora sp. NPDC050363 TaxID=3155642 RepID=UPI003403635E
SWGYLRGADKETSYTAYQTMIKSLRAAGGTSMGPANVFVRDSKDANHQGHPVLSSDIIAWAGFLVDLKTQRLVR